MLIYKPNDENDYVVLFGTAGWSSWFMASCEDLSPQTMKALWQRAKKLLPEDIKKTHPDNENISWLRLYKFKKEYKDDPDEYNYEPCLCQPVNRKCKKHRGKDDDV